MAEPIKGRKITLRQIMEEIAEDETFSDEEREQAENKVKELDFQEWCRQQMKSGG